MTQINPSSTQSDLDDDAPSEYTFSGKGVRGKFAKTLRENGYSVTIRNEDGTTSTRHVSPAEVMEQNRQREFLKQQSSNHTMPQEPHQTWTGDRIAGDKIGGDKVMGNKVQIGTVQGDAIAGNKITHSQNLAEAAKEIQTIIDQLAQSYPTITMPEKVGFASAIVQQIDTNPSLSTRVLSASKAGGAAAIGQFLNHPLSSFIIAAIEDWQQTKQS
jgi:hypothetical protein